MSVQGEAINKSNILSFDSLKEKHQKEFEMTEAFVALGDEMVSYKYHEKFPESKKNEFIQELLEFGLKTVSEEDYKELLGAVGIYTLILIIDKFTDIEIPTDDKERILYAEYLSDFGVMRSIINHFPEEEVTDVMRKGVEVFKIQTNEAKKLTEMYINQSNEIDTIAGMRLVEQDLGEQEGNGE